MTHHVILCLLTVAADLTPMREVLLRHRDKKQLTASEYGEVRDAVVRWVQAEILEGRPIAQMRSQLQASGPLSKPVDTNGDWIFEIHSGYIGDLSEVLQRNSRVISVKIGTGQSCNFDTTAIVYSRGGSRQPVAIVNASDNYERGRHLVNLKAHRDPASGGWTIASAWFTSSCTSTYVEACLRIDRGRKKLVRKLVPARIVGVSGKDIRIQIASNGRMVRFDYTDTNPDSWVTQFPATTIVEIDRDRVRETELARNLAGFIGRALERESKNWIGFDWIAAADCGPDTREISIRKDSQSRVLRIEGRAKNSAKALRLVPLTTVDGQFSPGCRLMTASDAMREELFTELRP